MQVLLHLCKDLLEKGRQEPGLLGNVLVGLSDRHRPKLAAGRRELIFACGQGLRSGALQLDPDRLGLLPPFVPIGWVAERLQVLGRLRVPKQTAGTVARSDSHDGRRRSAAQC
eukprot:SAG22_NODE_9714_length_573_cov_2.124473_1_plen_112_part_01